MGSLTANGLCASLEALARRDVGAWICGGHQPDHSTIGQLIQSHAAILNEEFFVALVKALSGRLHLAPGTVAGDSTVIEAAASRYRSLRAEAWMAAAQEARATAEANPVEPQLALKGSTRGAGGHAGPGTHARASLANADTELSPIEPEAVLQPRKDGVSRPSSKPTAMVHESGFIVGHHVDPSNERGGFHRFDDM